ncbi:uracil-DNA glycosylase family protein [Rhodoferax sp.]|uniref:uracil-DNA glycosylase n=1 Tax=Rhodoferax sp. TaxID=50421 RepID=UPI00276C6A3B|nr:uracil-DNA glycosylase family protein [Rhodoferax sp.]
MSLDLDARQRAMLLEMDIRIWQHPAVGEPPGAGSAAATPRLATKPPALSQATPVTAGARPPSPTRIPAPPALQPRLEATDDLPMGWDALSQAVLECQACGLCAGRKAAVLRAAPDQPQADWLVVGEPPDELEEREGRAFVGAAGQLLDNMLKAVGANRGGTGRMGAYATNIVKCRPAIPRNPESDELATCQAFLRQEIALVKPKLILATGRFAAQSLLHHSVPHIARVPLGKLRAQVHHFQGIPVIVSYHPTYLLRNQADKAKAWADLCLAMATLDAPATHNS